jgi:hypothetical protein
MRVNAFGLAAGWKLCAKMRLPGFTHMIFQARNWSRESQSGCPGGDRDHHKPFWVPHVFGAPLEIPRFERSLLLSCAQRKWYPFKLLSLVQALMASPKET